MPDARAVATQMYELIKSAPMSDRVRSQFLDMVRRGDPDAMLQQLKTYIRGRTDVGASVKAAGFRPFEEAYPAVECLHAQWRRTGSGA